MSKFYKTVITFTVLTEEDLERGPLELSTIVIECDEGGFVAHSEHRKTEQVTPEQMAELLVEAGSEPGFFSLPDEASDEEEYESWLADNPGEVDNS